MRVPDFSSLVVITWCLFWFKCLGTTSQQCDNALIAIRPASTSTQTGTHGIEEQSDVRCAIRCLNEPGCTSVNYGTSQGRTLCQINTETDVKHEFTETHGFVNLDVLVSKHGESYTHCSSASSAPGDPRPADCSDIKRLDLGHTDDEYIVYPDILFNVPIKVYCHEMSSTPKEYITLNSPENNFSLKDGRTMKNLYDCSTKGPYKSGRSSFEGLTKFSKIRVDLSTLVIQTTDFTFAKTTFGVPVEYGQGGDCHGESDCHLGGFQIDLRGSCLKVQSSVKWRLWRWESMLEVNCTRSHGDQLIAASCGGNCGFCMPDGDLALESINTC